MPLSKNDPFWDIDRPIFQVLPWVFVIIIMILAIVNFCWTGKADAPIEEAAEQLIFHKTGVEIDLSNWTPEN